MESEVSKTMEYEAIIQTISTVGFPIAMCVALLWYCVQQTKTHKEETKAYVESLNANTLVLQKVCDKLDSLKV